MKMKKIATILAAGILTVSSAAALPASAVLDYNGNAHSNYCRRHSGNYGYTNYATTISNPRNYVVNTGIQTQINSMTIITTNYEILSQVSLKYTKNTFTDTAVATSCGKKARVGSSLLFHDCYVNCSGSTSWSSTLLGQATTYTSNVSNYKGQNAVTYLGTVYWN